MLVRSGAQWRRGADGRRPYPAVSAPRGCALDLPGARADPAGAAAGERAGAWTDITVRHTGYTDRDLRERKLQRDGKILEDELAERPDDPFVLFNLGSIAVERQDWQRALDYLRRSLSGSAPTDSITRKLFALIARCHQMLGDLPGALAVCAEGLSFDR